jgi:hypothetical protein
MTNKTVVSIAHAAIRVAPNDNASTSDIVSSSTLDLDCKGRAIVGVADRS